jgi:hypothetical protein
MTALNDRAIQLYLFVNEVIMPSKKRTAVFSAALQPGTFSINDSLSTMNTSGIT